MAHNQRKHEKMIDRMDVRNLSNNQANNRQYMMENMYQRVLGELAMNRFKWEGFPESVDTRWLEMTLLTNALSVVFVDRGIFDEKTGEKKVAGTDRMFAMRAMQSGSRNLVDNPTHFTITGTSFNGRRLPAAMPGVVYNNDRACVPIWANYFRVPDMDIVKIYSWKLARIDRTIEINSDNARRTRVLTFSENSRLSAANVQDQLDRGESVIKLTETAPGMVNAFDLGIDPKSISELSVLRTRLWNECMGLLGINNSNQDKKERLVESEVGANDDQIDTMRRVTLNARQDAAELITDHFKLILEGKKVTVDYHSGLVAPENPIPNPAYAGATASADTDVE
jgi:hypothetical protein